MFLRETVIVGSILTIIFSFIIEFIFGIIGIKLWELSILIGFLLAGIYVGYNVGGNILKYGATAGMLTGIIGSFFIGLVSITLYWFKYGNMPSPASLIVFFIIRAAVYGITTSIGSIIGVIIKSRKSRKYYHS
ncbi:hypothetical protein BRM9_0761 [Methanobacterium formicicum]|uniref:DUF5518 domain-containing protein n=1 Tax=Methanobacterium formicicum TaxID=2162 RepID=A0A089Z9V1_METFO|nr:DUF5518 domain-containing protein [Methanobacterium formicicum]AIS31581.1 hypothetical protein BRM9_0761 [Methanobacterium formicicum]